MFYFHPYLAKIPILIHIFQMGWFNHQLEATLANSLRNIHRGFPMIRIVDGSEIRRENHRLDVRRRSQLKNLGTSIVDFLW